MKKIEKKKITEEQETAWFEAAKDNDIKTVQRMLKEGFDVNIRDRHGWSALHFACSYDNIDIARLLIENKADVNIQNNAYLRTPLYLTCYYGHLDLAKLLIDNGVGINSEDKYGNLAIGTLKKKHPKYYKELIEWLADNHPEKILELMAYENSPSNVTGL